MDQVKYVKEVSDLIELDMVKAVTNKCPWDENIEMIDLKLNVVGPKEDQFYSAYPILTKNIRRGNTILRFADS